MKRKLLLAFNFILVIGGIILAVEAIDPQFYGYNFGMLLFLVPALPLLGIGLYGLLKRRTISNFSPWARFFAYITLAVIVAVLAFVGILALLLDQGFSHITF